MEMLDAQHDAVALRLDDEELVEEHGTAPHPPKRTDERVAGGRRPVLLDAVLAVPADPAAGEPAEVGGADAGRRGGRKRKLHTGTLMNASLGSSCAASIGTPVWIRRPWSRASARSGVVSGATTQAATHAVLRIAS
jgi:hypothetical protein